MAQPVGPLVDQLLRRVRDPHGTAHSRDLVRRFLNYGEGFVGVAEQANLETFTFTTDRLRVLYNCKEVDATMRIVALRSILWNGRDLVKSPFGMMGGANLNWFRDIGPELLTWSPIGRDLFVLYPAMTTVQTVSVLALTHVPYPYTNDAALTQIEDHRLSDALDMAEALLLLRLRRLDLLKPAIKRIMETVQSQLEVDPSLIPAGDIGGDRAV